MMDKIIVPFANLHPLEQVALIEKKGQGIAFEKQVLERMQRELMDGNSG